MNDKERDNRLDPQMQQVLDVLTEYENAHPNAQIAVRRQNSVSIRIRIIDSDFQGVDWVDREPEVWQILSKLPDEVFVNITMLLLLTPKEAADSLANQEFENPIPSPL